MIEIFAFDKTAANEWDDFCNDCIQSTFLHTRRFLSYHEEKYQDKSLIIRKKNKIIGLFPAAELPKNNTIIVSHPGITYGGLLHSGLLMGEDAIQAFKAIADSYAKLQYKHLIYKAIPKIYHQSPCDDDLYALFRQGASQVRVDLSCAINLNNRQAISTRRKRCLSRAESSGVYIKNGIHLLEGMWKVLEENLAMRYGVKPVHSFQDITRLAQMFPEEINCTCALLKEEIIAGVVTFSTKTCMHAQYIASNACGKENSGLDLVFNKLIEQAKKMEKTWFDFGISNENEGKILNSGLYNFKAEFGGGGVTHEHFKLSL